MTIGRTVTCTQHASVRPIAPGIHGHALSMRRSKDQQTPSAPRAGDRIEIEEYWRLIDAGVFEEADGGRVELIEGLLLEMSPKSPEHERTIRWLARWLTRRLDEDGPFVVGVGSPLTIGRSEPEPDVVVFALDAPAPRHRATAALVVEVAHSSHERDLLTKPPLYARAEVPAYWVVDLARQVVVVHGRPEGGAYTTTREVGRDGRLDLEELGLPPLAVADLLTAARA
jgi:Uma2 family endonuclease